MKRILVLLVVFLFGEAVYAQSVFPSGAVLDTTLMELPQIEASDVIIVHQGYTVSYSSEWKIPLWVAYELTDGELNGESQRKGSFKRDTAYPGEQASTSDYTYSGFDRGHMAPAADMKWSDSAMSESFFITNICPQVPVLNQRYWLNLENLTRSSAERFGKVWVVSGPIVQSDSTRVIGAGKVVVPDAFFKAILAHDGSEYVSVAFIMQNDTTRQSVESSAIPVDSLEKRLSVNLFKNLPPESEDSEAGCGLIGW